MRFASPVFLLLLAVLPVLAIIGWPGQGYGRRREIASLAIRLLIASCLILSLAGLELVRASDRLAVVFLLDVSDSISLEARNSGENFIRQSLRSLGQDDQAALVVFGGDALVERSMSSSRELEDITSIPITSQTDLAQAIRLAVALYPANTARRMVIISDGMATSGDALAVARLAAASGIELLVHPLTAQSADELLLQDVQAPDELSSGEAFSLDVTVEASRPTSATLSVYAQGTLAYQGSYTLQRGSQTLSLPLRAGSPGFASYDIRLSPAVDTLYQNNQLTAYTRVSGPPAVLLVAPAMGEPIGYERQPRPDESSHLQQALLAGGFDVTRLEPTGLPAELSELAQYASVVLVDVPARQLSNHQMSVLQSYVRDLGGGLVTVGGLTSYGVGGYFRTPLEDILPLDMQIKDEQRRPSLTIVFIIDHSGSMAETSGGAMKLELAKEAVMRSIELLMPNDRVGVIAFDETASWVVPVTVANDPAAILQAVGTIQPGGGTDIMAGVQAMANVLPDDPAQVRHVILLTDGGADPTGIPELVEQLFTQQGITLSTVGVGTDVAPYLSSLAEIGGGRYHFTADPASIPSIFTEETLLASRAYIVEEPFYPSQVSSSPILNGINETPALAGYVATSLKAVAHPILVSHLDDPILADWQYGLGRVVSFTSDATGRWASLWLDWDGYAGFWGQVVESTINQMESSPLELQVNLAGSQADLTLEARQVSAPGAASGGVSFLNDYHMQASIVDPQGEPQQVGFTQVAPGRYEAAFSPSQPGVYLVRVSGTSPASSAPAVGETFAWVLSYSPEYRYLMADPSLLYRIIQETGGRVTPTQPGRIFEHNLTASRASAPVWQSLLTLAAFLLPVDIAVRRLALTRQDLLRGFKKLKGRLKPGERLPSRAEPSSQASLRSLMQLKQRRRPPPQSASHLPAQELPSQSEEPQPSAEAPPAPKPDLPQGTTASHLLRQKRARRDNPPPK